MLNFPLIETTLYVEDQAASTSFYEALLEVSPSLNVPGMTEFTFSKTFKLGLMPNQSIAKILLDKTPHPNSGNGIPRCELYLYVEDIQKVFDRALSIGAILIDPIQERDWGDTVCYFSDPDGHILAFAEKSDDKKHNV